MPPLSLQSWSYYVNNLLAGCGQPPASYATLQHYYNQGCVPVDCWRAVMRARNAVYQPALQAPTTETVQ